VGAGNIADRCYQDHTHYDDIFYETWLDDECWHHGRVTRFRANPFGLHGIIGNVFEWCQDYYENNYAGAPSDGSPRMENSVANQRVCRGGAWNQKAQFARSACRTMMHFPDRGGHFGLRPAMSIMDDEPLQ
jgi:formylglycine-generating enzyme required for sulfatase activity